MTNLRWNEKNLLELKCIFSNYIYEEAVDDADDDETDSEWVYTSDEDDTEYEDDLDNGYVYDKINDVYIAEEGVDYQAGHFDVLPDSEVEQSSLSVIYSTCIGIA